MDYEYIDKDEEIIRLVEEFESKERIAVDFECEFNLHVYGEHLSTIQINDGSKYYLVDVLSDGITERGLESLSNSNVKKLWFDAKSDHMLVYKNYHLKINNIFDIRALALALGFNGNLSSLKAEFLNRKEDTSKKKNQRANWMKRPIADDLIEYALEDVDGLFELEDILEREVKEKGVEENARFRLKSAQTLNEITPSYMNVSGYGYMNKRERIYLKYIFEERDRIAKRFNLPSSRIMDKKTMLGLVYHPPKSESELIGILESSAPRFKWILKDAVKRALKNANREISTLPEKA